MNISNGITEKERMKVYTEFKDIDEITFKKKLINIKNLLFMKIPKS
jgi:hypothetical protein